MSVGETTRAEHTSKMSAFGTHAAAQTEIASVRFNAMKKRFELELQGTVPVPGINCRYISLFYVFFLCLNDSMLTRCRVAGDHSTDDSKIMAQSSNIYSHEHMCLAYPPIICIHINVCTLHPTKELKSDATSRNRPPSTSSAMWVRSKSKSSN